MAVVLSVIIPVLNKADTIVGEVENWLESGVAGEVIVADGGSIDATADLARVAGAGVVTALRGRGSQMAAGAKTAVGDWLLFIHADTRLEPGWQMVTERFMADAANRFCAGHYRFVLDDTSPEARRLERMVAWRCQTFGLPYGDQGLLISNEFYEHLGGFPSIPLMEDVALVRRIAKHRLKALPADALTSAVRYHRDGYILRPARNLLCLGLYFLGVRPAFLVLLYTRGRE